MNKIIYYSKSDGTTLDGNDFLFVMNDVVWQDNQETYESQAAVVGFDDCIRERPDLGWKPGTV